MLKKNEVIQICERWPDSKTHFGGDINPLLQMNARVFQREV
jgi:hypothetical protein